MYLDPGAEVGGHDAPGTNLDAEISHQEGHAPNVVPGRAAAGEEAGRPSRKRKIRLDEVRFGLRIDLAHRQDLELNIDGMGTQVYNTHMNHLHQVIRRKELHKVNSSQIDKMVRGVGDWIEGKTALSIAHCSP